MDHFGSLSIIPPLLAIGLAFLTRKVILSLLVGIFSGALIATHWQVFSAIKKSGLIIWNNKMYDEVKDVISFSKRKCMTKENV